MNRVIGTCQGMSLDVLVDEHDIILSTTSVLAENGELINRYQHYRAWCPLCDTIEVRGISEEKAHLLVQKAEIAGKESVILNESGATVV